MVGPRPHSGMISPGSWLFFSRTQGKGRTCPWVSCVISCVWDLPVFAPLLPYCAWAQGMNWISEITRSKHTLLADWACILLHLLISKV